MKDERRKGYKNIEELLNAKDISHMKDAIDNGFKAMVKGFDKVSERQDKTDVKVNKQAERIKAVETSQKWTFRICVGTMGAAALLLGKKFLILIGIL